MRGLFWLLEIQNGPSVFHIDPFHGLIWPRCKGQFSPKFWYQNSPISIGLNWPQKQYRSGLTRFGPIFGAELALFILRCGHQFSLKTLLSALHRNQILRTVGECIESCEIKSNYFCNRSTQRQFSEKYLFGRRFKI